MKKQVQLSTLFLMFVSFTFCKGQNETNFFEDNIKYKTEYLINSNIPIGSTRTIKQDKKGNIWMATSNGVYIFDGESFTNITSKESSTRFFSVLEDKKGDFWFGSIGSGVYYYPSATRRSDSVREGGKVIQNFSKLQGLAGNQVTSIYEDKTGNIWFATESGASRFDPSTSLTLDTSTTTGKSFRNYRMNEGSIGNIEDNAVNAILEDKNGNFWFGTSGKTFIYDGKKYIVITHEGNPFWNVRSIIEDKKGNIWLGGECGLWRHDTSTSRRSDSLRAGSNTFSKISQNFVSNLYEDRKGNIWTSAQIVNSQGWVKGWTLSRYNKKTLSDKNPTVTEIKSNYENYNGMTFGILEANDGNIWFGAIDGVYRFDGNTITDFKNKVFK